MLARMLPIAPAVVLPDAIAGMANGQLDPGVLLEVQRGVFLERDAAWSFADMANAARADGVELTIEFAYRTFVEQRDLFFRRYVPWDTGTGESVVYMGVRYWRVPGVATAAVPGSSNHGLGLGIDVFRDSAGRVVVWLTANAERFGWAAELQSEPWHWIRFAGNYSAPAPAPAPDPIQLPDPKDPDVKPFLIIEAQGQGVWFFAVGQKALTLGGLPGAYGALRAAGAVDGGTVPDAELATFVARWNEAQIG